MEAYVIVVVLALLVSVGIYLFTRYSETQKVLSGLRWVLRIVQITINYWGFEKAYSDKVVLGVRYINLIEVLSLEGTDLRQARGEVAAFVAETYNHFYPEGMDRERAKRIAASGYMVVLSHQEILDTIRGLQDHDNLDVRKATYVVIDILGELFDRRDKLSKEYFQHLVYGLNKCLVLFKRGGYNRSTVKEIYATLWRIYQLTKAFNKLKAGDGLTKKEFYEKITIIIDGMLRVLGE